VILFVPLTPFDLEANPASVAHGWRLGDGSM